MSGIYSTSEAGRRETLAFLMSQKWVLMKDRGDSWQHKDDVHFQPIYQGKSVDREAVRTWSDPKESLANTQ